MTLPAPYRSPVERDPPTVIDFRHRTAARIIEALRAARS